MNYYELCTEVLQELFYEKVDSFEELDNLTEGLRVKALMNRVLRDVCAAERSAWKFREQTKTYVLVDGVSHYDKPDGYIQYFRYPNVPLKLYYLEDHETVPLSLHGLPLQYWIDNDQIRLYPVPDKGCNNRILICEYLTNCIAKDACGILKHKMEYEDDVPIIPSDYHNVLIYGVCRDWRANAADAQVIYYSNKYKEAYAAMLENCKISKEYPNGLDFDMLPTDPQSNLLRAFHLPYDYRI